MGLPGRNVTEYVGKDSSTWLINGPGASQEVAVAVRLRSRHVWVVIIPEGYWLEPSRREARRSLLWGNGRLTGGHPEVTTVIDV